LRSKNKPTMANATPTILCHDGGSRKKTIPAMAMMTAPPARIVRAADSHPAGEGLRWIASGFGARGLTDQEILEREFIVYDALYAECKHRASRGLVA